MRRRQIQVAVVLACTILVLGGLLLLSQSANAQLPPSASAPAPAQGSTHGKIPANAQAQTVAGSTTGGNSAPPAQGKDGSAPAQNKPQAPLQGTPTATPACGPATWQAGPAQAPARYAIQAA